MESIPTQNGIIVSSNYLPAWIYQRHELVHVIFLQLLHPLSREHIGTKPAEQTRTDIGMTNVAEERFVEQVLEYSQYYKIYQASLSEPK